MSDTTTRELQWIVSAKDVGAAEVFKKLGDDARFTVKQIQDAQNKVGRPLEAAQLQMAEYRKAYHETIIKLRADTESTVARLTTTPAAIAARESAEAVRRSIAESRAAMAQEESSTHTGLLRSLNAKVGRGSTFSMGARALGGAGALLGVGMSSYMLRDATEQANKLDQELRGGTKTAAEAADAMARQIPILGGVYSAAASINQIFGSQAREIDRINALNKVTEAATSGRLELLKREREEYKAIALQIRELSQTGARVGLGGGASGILALQQHQQNSKDDLAADIKKATDANKDSVKDKMAEVHAAANATFHGSIRGTVVGAWNDMFSKVGINIPGLKGLAGAEEKESEADRGAATTEQGVLDAQRIQADAATKKELTRKQAQDAQTTARQIIEATREYNRQKYEDFRKTEDAIGQLMASNHQHELRQAGLFYSADAAALSQSVSLKKEALDREFQEHLQALQREKVAGIATQADIDRAVADARAQNHALDVQYAQSKEDLQRQTGQRMAGLALEVFLALRVLNIEGVILGSGIGYRTIYVRLGSYAGNLLALEGLEVFLKLPIEGFLLERNRLTEGCGVGGVKQAGLAKLVLVIAGHQLTDCILGLAEVLILLAIVLSGCLDDLACGGLRILGLLPRQFLLGGGVGLYALRIENALLGGRRSAVGFGFLLFGAGQALESGNVYPDLAEHVIPSSDHRSPDRAVECGVGGCVNLGHLVFDRFLVGIGGLLDVGCKVVLRILLMLLKGEDSAGAAAQADAGAGL